MTFYSNHSNIIAHTSSKDEEVRYVGFLATIQFYDKA